jgi:hypothetical protein
MRTSIATHELLPKGLYLENLSIETGRVSICGVGDQEAPLPALRSAAPPGSTAVTLARSQTFPGTASPSSRKSTWGGCAKPMEPSPMPGG